jgi:hypothetical protein
VLWGSNGGGQLGYSGKELKESLVPIIFGGKITLEGKEKGEEKQSELDYKYDLGFKYVDVVCGSS